MSLRRRLRSLVWRVPVEQEVREEIQHHQELRARELMERGWDAESARAEAARRTAGMELTLTRLGEERNRRFAFEDWRQEIAQDIRFALRQCRLQPGFTLAAILTLAIGIGLTTAIFSIVRAVVLKPYPFPDPERVVTVYTEWQGRLGNTSVGNFDYIRRRASTLEHLAAVQYASVNLAEGGNPERVLGARVTWSYFPTFGMQPMLGRVITEDDDAPGRPNVVVLSHGLWQRRFGADRAIVGRDITLNGVPHTVIGVMPPVVDHLIDDEELWVPAAFTAERLAMHDEHFLDLFARRRAGVTLAQVNDELGRIAEGLRRDFPHEDAEIGSVARPFSETMVGNYRLRLAILLGAVLLVLAIACGNVANLLLARLAARSRELAIRAAVGAGRGRIVRQVLTESLVLTSLGGAAGVLAAYWALPGLLALAPSGVPRLDRAAIDGTVAAAAMALVAVSTLVVGLLPAWQATRGQMREQLGESRGAGLAHLRPWVRQGLIGVQATIVLVVLAGAALLVRSAINLQRVPLGFDATGVLMARVTLPSSSYSTAQVQQAFLSLRDRLEAAPGVAAAALDSQAPLTNTGGSNGLIPEGRPLRVESVINARLHIVTPGYFKTIGLPVTTGRGFSDADARDGQLVMIINEAMAREGWPGESAIGKRVACCEGGPDDPRWKTVVGVVPDVKSRGPAEPIYPEFYLPMRQAPDVTWGWLQNTMNLVVKSANGNGLALAGAVRGAVAATDPTLPVYGMTTMAERRREVLAQSRFNTLLMACLGLTGLALAAIGIYSVIAWLVAQRVKEIGVRLALGAPRGEVVRDMTLQGMKPVAAGLAVGLLAAIAGGRVLASQLFDVGARDPLSLAAVAGLLLGVAFLAAFVPAWRAASIDPAKALHE